MAGTESYNDTEGDSERAPDLRFIVSTGQGHKGESDDSAGHCLGGRRESRNEFWPLVRVWTKLSVFTAVPTTFFLGAARIDNKTLTNPSCPPTNQKCLRLTDTRKWLMDDEMREVIATPCADKPKSLGRPNEIRNAGNRPGLCFGFLSSFILFFPPICIPAPNWYW